MKADVLACLALTAASFVATTTGGRSSNRRRHKEVFLGENSKFKFGGRIDYKLKRQDSTKTLLIKSEQLLRIEEQDFAMRPGFGDTEVSCQFRTDCILPCSFNTGSQVVIHWIVKPGEIQVHSYYYDQDQLTLQNQRYQGRTSLFTEQLGRGNASLRLRDVAVQDEGRYQCYSSTVNGNKETYIQLKVYDMFLMPLDLEDEAVFNVFTQSVVLPVIQGGVSSSTAVCPAALRHFLTLYSPSLCSQPCFPRLLSDPPHQDQFACNTLKRCQSDFFKDMSEHSGVGLDLPLTDSKKTRR
ncbi:hypothetical protein CCH79_00003940 [Gambusia affinis]|uniref:Ig-like domain-containing protein n=1 Tax=Gambusia affinis TaxID=33528 RepID=A0A315V4I1_GAMAF|nr:hypothetical protein CCH79_00003940 [Gambusia affinis]